MIGLDKNMVRADHGFLSQGSPRKKNVATNPSLSLPIRLTLWLVPIDGKFNSNKMITHAATSSIVSVGRQVFTGAVMMSSATSSSLICSMNIRSTKSWSMIEDPPGIDDKRTSHIHTRNNGSVEGQRIDAHISRRPQDTLPIIESLFTK